MQEETDSLEEVMTTLQLNVLDQFNDHKRKRDSRWLLVLVLGETVLKTFTLMSKVESNLSVNSKGGDRGDIYA